jgi:hypothetical protein
MPTPPINIRLRHNPAFAAQSHGWCYLACKFERVFAKRNYVDYRDGKRK